MSGQSNRAFLNASEDDALSVHRSVEYQHASEDEALSEAHECYDGNRIVWHGNRNKPYITYNKIVRKMTR